MKRILATLALVLGTASIAQAATIANGSFEAGGVNPGSGFSTVSAVNTTAITGWTVSAGSVDYIGGLWQASNGVRSIDMSGGNVGTISTTITNLVMGYSYELLFDLSANPDGPPPLKTITVSVGNTSDEYTFDRALLNNTRANMRWVTESLVFVATSTTALLTFASGTTTAFGPALDNVRVSTVPLPAGGLLLLSGLAGFAALRRRKAR